VKNSTEKAKKKRLIIRLILLFITLLLCLSLFVPLSPTKSILRTSGFMVTGRLHFPNEHIGNVVTDRNGNDFTIFREVVVDPTGDRPPQPGAVLILHFRVTDMTPEHNKIYSLLPLPLYIGDPGFRRKLFAINGEYCQSIYEWDRVQDAENYVNSVALKTVRMHSAPDSFSFEIIKK